MSRSLPQEAARWFEKAGSRGHAEAQFNLGEMLPGCKPKVAVHNAGPPKALGFGDKGFGQKDVGTDDSSNGFRFTA